MRTVYPHNAVHCPCRNVLEFAVCPTNGFGNGSFHNGDSNQAWVEWQPAYCGYVLLCKAKLNRSAKQIFRFV